MAGGMRLLTLLLALLLLAPAVQAGDVYVVFWFDTEDHITPSSDDAALRIAEILTRRHIRGTFKLTGAKARVLEQRGRRDVLAALRLHDIGYHTDFHSVPPAPAAYLDRMTWDEGAQEFYRREAAGARDVARILKRPLSCYGQPGNSWAPHVYPALRRMGIAVYLDSGSHVGLDHDMFWYCGLLNFYELRGKETRLALGDPAAVKLQTATAEFDRIFDQLRNAPGPGSVISIVYHPWEFVTKKAWDAVNFLHGANPPPEQWQPGEPKTKEESERDYSNFASYVAHIAGRPGVKFATATDLPALYPDRARDRAFTREEVEAIARRNADEVSWWKSDDSRMALSAAEVFSLVAQALEPAAKVFKAESFYGPRHRGRTTRQADLDRREIREAAAQALAAARDSGCLPAEVWTGSESLSPEDFLSAAARALADPSLEKIPVRAARFLPYRHASPDSEKLLGWIIHPAGMRAPNNMELAALQTWTLKPALMK
jgi:hypothetical protein